MGDAEGNTLRLRELFQRASSEVDLSDRAATVNYRDLPRSFHKYFTEPTQEETFEGS